MFENSLSLNVIVGRLYKDGLFRTVHCWLRFRVLQFGLVVSLDELDGLIVELGFNACSSFTVIKCVREIVELVQGVSQVVDRHCAIMIEVETEPVILHEHRYVVVSLPDVLNNVFLAVLYCRNEHPNEVCGLVIEENDTLIQLT